MPFPSDNLRLQLITDKWKCSLWKPCELRHFAKWQPTVHFQDPITRQISDDSPFANEGYDDPFGALLPRLNPDLNQMERWVSATDPRNYIFTELHGNTLLKPVSAFRTSFESSKPSKSALFQDDLRTKRTDAPLSITDALDVLRNQIAQGMARRRLSQSKARIEVRSPIRSRGKRIIWKSKKKFFFPEKSGTAHQDRKKIAERVRGPAPIRNTGLHLKEKNTERRDGQGITGCFIENQWGQSDDEESKRAGVPDVNRLVPGRDNIRRHPEPDLQEWFFAYLSSRKAKHYLYLMSNICIISCVSSIQTFPWNSWCRQQ